MADMRSIAVTVMFFAAILSGTLYFSGSVFSAFGVDTDEGSVGELSEELEQETESTEGRLQEETRDIDSGIEASVFFLRSVFDVILVLFNLFLKIPSIASTFIGELKLPQWTSLLISIPFAYALITLVFEARRSG